MLVFAYLAGNSTETGCHKRHPVSEYNHVGTFFCYFFAHLNPVEWIAGVHLAEYCQIFRSRVGTELRFARKKEIRVLQSESVHLHVVALTLELGGKPLVERRQTASIRVCRTYYYYVHK